MQWIAHRSSRYLDKDAIRGNDSLVTFQEVLELAQEREVGLTNTLLVLKGPCL